MPWTKLNDSAENLPDGLKFNNPNSALDFCIEIPRPVGKESWDFAGWVYLILNSPIGELSTKWKRVYLGTKQFISFSSLEVKYSFQLLFRPVHWLTNFSIDIWGWHPTEIVVSGELNLDQQWVMIFEKNQGRKDFWIENLGTDTIEIFWGLEGSPLSVLIPGAGVSDSVTLQKEALFARSIGNGSKVRFIERSVI